MPKFNKIQTSFNSGELSPKLAIRGDIDNFKNGCKKAKNVEILPQGGFKRRGGFISNNYINDRDQFPYDEYYHKEDYLLKSFEISKELSYILVIYRDRDEGKIKIRIFDKNDYIQTIEYYDENVNNNIILKDIKTAQNVNNFIICHPDVPTKNLQVDENNVFTIEDINFINKPQYVFNDDLSPDKESEKQLLFIVLDNMIYKSDGGKQGKSSSSSRKFKFSFQGKVSQEITYNSPYTYNFNLSGADPYGGGQYDNTLKENLDSDYSLFNMTINTNDDTKEIKTAIVNQKSGYYKDITIPTRNTFASDLDYIDKIIEIINFEVMTDFFTNISPSYTAKYYFNLEAGSITGSYASGNLSFDIRIQDIITYGTTYYIQSDFYFRESNDVSSEIKKYSQEDLGLTTFSIIKELKKFNIFKNFEKNIFVTPYSKAQMEYQVIQSQNPTITGAGMGYNISIHFEDSAEYDLIQGEFTEPKKSQFENTVIKNYKLKTGFSGLEDAWSETRGYPSSAAFIENRLVFGGSKSLPTFLWASKIGNFFDFGNTYGDVDEAILNVSPSAPTLNKIKYITGSKSLQLFTEGSEHYNPNALTSESISLPLQSNEGISDVEPVIIDNATYYIDGSGKNLRRFLYDDLEQSYRSDNVSLIGEHLINNIIDISARSYENSNYIYLTKEDGKLTIFQTIREQKISGFFEWEIEGASFLNTEILNGELYALVRAGDAIHLLRYSENAALDFEGSALPEIVGGKYSLIYKDDNDKTKFVYINKTNSISEIYDYFNNNIPMEEFTDAYYGVDFTPIVETTDITVNFGRGERISNKKKINEVFLHCNNTAGYNLTYKGKKYIINYRDLNLTNVSGLIIPGGNYDIDYSFFNGFTGDKRVKMYGYIERDNIKITQDYPYNFGEILGITLNIKA